MAEIKEKHAYYEYVNHKPQAMQGRAMKMKKIKKKMTGHNFFVIKNTKFDRQLQKSIGAGQDETSSINASYNKDIHTVVIT